MESYIESSIVFSNQPQNRLKVHRKGYFNSQWIIKDSEGATKYTATPSPYKIEVMATENHQASTAYLPSSLSEPFKEISFSTLHLPPISDNSTLNSYTDRSIIKPAHRQSSTLQGLFINIPSFINLEQKCRQPFDISFQGRSFMFEIERIGGLAEWSGWHIYLKSNIDQPLARFIWFESGSKRSNSSLGGIEFFASLPQPVTSALVLIIMAYFLECNKATVGQQENSSKGLKFSHIFKPLIAMSSNKINSIAI